MAVSGSNIIQQYLAAGLLDEIQIHLVPVLLGGGEGCSTMRALNTSNWRARG